MKATIAAVLAGLVGLSGLGATAAQAEDFTIIVPVEVSNLPEGAQPQVECYVFAEDRSNILGIGEAAVPGGAADFSGTVTVAFDLFEGTDTVVPSDATGYSCHLMVHPDADHAALSWARCEEVGRDPRNEPLICGARGAPVVGLVEGTF